MRNVYYLINHSLNAVLTLTLRLYWTSLPPDSGQRGSNCCSCTIPRRSRTPEYIRRRFVPFDKCNIQLFLWEVDWKYPSRPLSRWARTADDRLRRLSDSIKDNIQPTAVCAFRPRWGNLRKHSFRFSPSFWHNQEDQITFSYNGNISDKRVDWEIIADQRQWIQHVFAFADLTGLMKAHCSNAHRDGLDFFMSLFKIQSLLSTYLER